MVRGKNALPCGIVLVALLLVCAVEERLHARQELTIAVTSNLEGRFSPDEKDQDSTDQLLLIAQGISEERRTRRVDLYLDLGNAFYPGALSRYSMGSVVMDYLEYFGCDASLVSSRDLGIGAESLAFLQEGKRTRLLSSNLMRGEERMFAPYFLVPADGRAVAVIGISSGRTLVDIAEQQVHNIRLAAEKDALAGALAAVRAARPDARVVLLSGLSVRDTVALLAEFREVDLALCGGDSTGELFEGRTSRIDLADGRSLLFMPNAGGYYLAELVLDGAISVKQVVHRNAAPVAYQDERYREFAERLARWKRKYREEEDVELANTGSREVRLSDESLANLLRDRFNAEVAMVEKNTVTALPQRGAFRRSDVQRAVNQDYGIFVFTLTGDELARVMRAADSPVCRGVENDSVAGYRLEPNRSYRVAATQSAHARVAQILARDIPYRNTWQNVSELIAGDIRGPGTVFATDHAYLDRRFRATIDLYFSNFIDNSLVERSESLEAPPGKPSETYRKWGMENRADVAIFNRFHRFAFTPYMLYVRQDEFYLQNLLRGAFVYTFNLHEIVKPYHKSQCDTVVREVYGERPVVIRETAGSNFVWKTFQAKLGAGFEKPVHEPVSSPRYGVEAIVNLTLPFTDNFSYRLNMDSFFSVQEAGVLRRYIRSDIENGLAYSFNRFLGVSVKHKFYYYYSGVSRELYRDSQILTALDLKTDFKVW